MIIRRFLLWMRTAAPDERAEGVAALARAYLDAELSEQDRLEAEEALTAMLDDPAPQVRRALADALGAAAEAPVHLVVALAYDHSDIAAIVLARSPVLDDADLIDCAAVGDALTQCAIAIRSGLSAGVAAALAETGCLDALISLAGNASARIPEFSFLRMMQRHGDETELREALLARRDLPISVRHAVTVSISESLAGYAIEHNLMGEERCRRLTRDARERATVELAFERSEESPALVAYLRDTQQLTPVLLLRAILSGAIAFFEAALAELAAMPRERVRAFLSDPYSGGAMAVYRRSGLPGALAPVFRAAICAFHEAGLHDRRSARPALSRPAVTSVIAACRLVSGTDMGHVLSLLRRLEAEAAREAARERAEQLADQAALEALMAIDPEGMLLLETDHAAGVVPAGEDEPAADLDWPEIPVDEPILPQADEIDAAALENAFAAEVEERRQERLQIA